QGDPPAVQHQPAHARPGLHPGDAARLGERREPPLPPLPLGRVGDRGTAQPRHGRALRAAEHQPVDAAAHRPTPGVRGPAGTAGPPAARLTAAYRCPPGARHGPDTAVPGSGARPSGPDRPPSPPATRGGAPPTAPAAYSAAPFRRILPGTSATSGIVPPHRPPALPGSLPQIYRPANQVE